MTIITNEQHHNILNVEKSLYVDSFGNFCVDILLSRPGRLIYEYLYHLRKCEFYFTKNGFKKILYMYHNYCLNRLSYKLGYQIPIFTCGTGLKIHHFGHIIINGDARLGDYCKLYPGVIVGSTPNGVPFIGNNVFIGSGAKILGKLSIGNNVIIQPNSIVTNSVPSNVIVGGIPAKVLKYLTCDNYAEYSDYIRPF